MWVGEGESRGRIEDRGEGREKGEGREGRRGKGEGTELIFFSFFFFTRYLDLSHVLKEAISHVGTASSPSMRYTSPPLSHPTLSQKSIPF